MDGMSEERKTRRFVAVSSRYLSLETCPYETLDEAISDIQVGNEFGSHYGHGVYDNERGEAYYPRPHEMDGDHVRERHQTQIMKAFQLDAAPVVAGEFDPFPDYDDD